MYKLATVQCSNLLNLHQTLIPGAGLGQVWTHTPSALGCTSLNFIVNIRYIIIVVYSFLMWNKWTVSWVEQQQLTELKSRLLNAQKEGGKKIVGMAITGTAETNAQKEGRKKSITLVQAQLPNPNTCQYASPWWKRQSWSRTHCGGSLHSTAIQMFAWPWLPHNSGPCKGKLDWEWETLVTIHKCDCYVDSPDKQSCSGQWWCMRRVQCTVESRQ